LPGIFPNVIGNLAKKLCIAEEKIGTTVYKKKNDE
jgi:hypothetical protein